MQTRRPPLPELTIPTGPPHLQTFASTDHLSARHTHPLPTAPSSCFNLTIGGVEPQDLTRFAELSFLRAPLLVAAVDAAHENRLGSGLG